MLQIQIFPDAKQLIQSAVQIFITLADQAIQARGVFCVALSGGSTPMPLYQALGRLENEALVDWDKVHLFWGDERHVPPDHPDSNYRMVHEQLLRQISIPVDNVHRVPTEMEVRMAAFSYEEELRDFFGGDWPRFDLVLLGMGNDGHTASLFPHSAGINEEDRWYIANRALELAAWRLTLTKNAINAARKVVIMVSGESKANMLTQVLAGSIDPYEKPIQLVSPVDGTLLWMVTQDAAKKLPPELL